MSDQPRNDDLQALWQSQPRGDSGMSLDQIRIRARRSEEKVARRNRREYIAAAVEVVGFGALMWYGPSITIRIGAGLIVSAAVFVVHQLHRRGAATSLPTDLALTSALEFHRAQLVRQRNLLHSVWLWYLMPFAPGAITLLIGLALANPGRMSGVIIAIGMVNVAVVFGLHVLNRRGAARIQQRLDRLSENH